MLPFISVRIVQATKVQSQFDFRVRVLRQISNEVVTFELTKFVSCTQMYKLFRVNMAKG